jgi:hypothetical protein
MKKLVVVCSIVFLLLFLLPSSAKAQYDTGRFAFKFYGGLNYLAGADLNASFEGWSQYWSWFWGLFGYSTTNQFNGANLGMNFGGDFIFQFTPSMGVGLGVGYLQASRKNDIAYTNAIPGMPALNETYEVRASAIPIKVSFYYFLPTSGMVGVNLNAGVGYYLATAYGLYRAEIPGTWEQNVYDNFPGGGIGFHGGVGLEFKLSPMIGIFLEGQGRYAAFSNFEGDALYTNSVGGSATTTGKLWTYDLTGAGHTWTLSVISNTTPTTGGGVSNVRQTKVDFSGFSLVLGIIVRL